VAGDGGKKGKVKFKKNRCWTHERQEKRMVPTSTIIQNHEISLLLGRNHDRHRQAYRIQNAEMVDPSVCPFVTTSHANKAISLWNHYYDHYYYESSCLWTVKFSPNEIIVIIPIVSHRRHHTHTHTHTHTVREQGRQYHPRGPQGTSQEPSGGARWVLVQEIGLVRWSAGTQDGGEKACKALKGGEYSLFISTSEITTSSPSTVVITEVSN